MNINLTTANNNLEIYFNGTLVKQIIGPDGNKAFQKWKTVTKTVYGSQNSMKVRCQLVAESEKIYSEGYSNTKVVYGFYVKVWVDQKYDNNASYVKVLYYDPSNQLKYSNTITNSSSLTTGLKVNNYYKYNSFRGNQSGYDRKSFTGKIYIYCSTNNTTGGTIDGSRAEESATTPKVSYTWDDVTETSSSAGSSRLCVVGTTTTVEERVEDN